MHSKTPYIKTRIDKEKVRQERADIVHRMKLEGWTSRQIAGYIGIGRGAVEAAVVRLKKEGRLPNIFLRGTINPPIGEGYSTGRRIRR